MLKDDLESRLSALDYEASLRYPGELRFSLVIAGGGALVLLDVISRATFDIDVLAASRELSQLFEKYDLNTQIAAHADCFPMNYEDRVVPVFTGEKIDVYSISLEDMVISKLCAARDKDLADIQASAVVSRLDWALLETLATADDEIKANILNERAYNIFKSNYDDYVRRFRP